MAAAVRRGEWERLAVYLALAVLARARELPEASLDDLLSLLDAGEEEPHARRKPR
jgi:hypothetical protein